MKLTEQDYILLIKYEAGKLQAFSRPDGTSAPYKYMREVCERLIEISNEFEVKFPNRKAEYSNE